MPSSAEFRGLRGWKYHSLFLYPFPTCPDQSFWAQGRFLRSQGSLGTKQVPCMNRVEYSQWEKQRRTVVLQAVQNHLTLRSNKDNLASARITEDMALQQH